jgi:hypothetical protein
MANGIATVASVVAMARAQMLGFFGAAGLALPAVERAVGELGRSLRGLDNWGVNLIHTPAAYMDLTPAVVRCAVAGLASSATAPPTTARCPHRSA